MTPCGYWCYLAIFLLSWISLYFIVRRKQSYLESRGLTLGPLYIIFNMRSLGEALGRRLSGSRRASALLSASPVIAVALMAYALYFLAHNMSLYFISPGNFSAVVPLIPFVTIRSAPLLAMFLSAVPLLIIPHELSHALAAAARGIKIRGGGLLLIAFLLGAFVELDEDLFRRASWRHRAVTAAAGPTANAVIAGVIFMLLVTQPTSYLYLPQSVAAPFYTPAAGVMIAGVVPGSPAQRVGLSQGDVILSVNGTPLRSISDLTTLNLSAGESLILQVERAGRVHTYRVGLAEISGKAMIGVYLANNMKPRLQLPYFGTSADYFLLWLLMISFAVAVFNMLPMAPFDGAVFMDAMLSPVVKDDSIRRAILYALYGISAILLMGNIALSLIRFGVPSF